MANTKQTPRGGSHTPSPKEPAVKPCRMRHNMGTPVPGMKTNMGMPQSSPTGARSGARRAMPGDTDNDGN